jgi:V8-like Glu-specific endopeptidase
MRFFKAVLFFALSISLVACSESSDGKKSKKSIEDTPDVAEAPEVPFVPCVKKDLADQLSAKVIYGEDNRLEYCETSKVDQMALSDSTAVLVKKTDLVEKNSTVLKYDATTFAQSFNLCKEEPFRDQLSLGFCSGFLVAPDTMVTAGHCIRTEAACSNTAFVFGFNVKSVGAYPTETLASEVYYCSKLVKSVVETSGKDYAVVKLDRPVVGHNPLKLRQSGSLNVNDSVVVMGYPSGIPLKIAGGAKVRSLQSGYFVANLDTYGGNSGSAVFNETTGEVEGILVRGETDFVINGNCRVSNKCKDDECRGEDVTTIAEVLGDL